MSRLPGLGPRGEGWLALQLLLLLAIGASALLFAPSLSGAQRSVAIVVGAAMILLGVGVVALAARQLGQGATPLPRPPEGAPLVVEGLYREVRHPIYVGVILSAAGWSVAMASLPALLLSGALVVLLDLKARREEAWLIERHPRYAGYLRRTRRFIPRLY